jgi:hypothetical protein
VILNTGIISSSFSSSSLFALYIEHLVYHCGFYFAPFRPSNSDYGYFEEGESTAGYTFTSLGSFACPGIHTQVKESRFYVSFKGRGNRSKVTCQRSHTNWPVMVSNPRCSDHESATSTTRPRHTSVCFINPKGHHRPRQSNVDNPWCSHTSHRHERKCNQT